MCSRSKVVGLWQMEACFKERPALQVPRAGGIWGISIFLLFPKHNLSFTGKPRTLYFYLDPTQSTSKFPSISLFQLPGAGTHTGIPTSQGLTR